MMFRLRRLRTRDAHAYWPGAPDALASFAVYPMPGKRDLRVRVEIYASREDIQRVVRAEGRIGGFRMRTRGLVAMCTGWEERRGPQHGRRRLPTFAILRIPKDDLRMSTITHEAFHATMRWAQRVGIREINTHGNNNGNNNMRWPRPVATDEERCAEAHEQICRQIVVWAERLGFLP